MTRNRSEHELRSSERELRFRRFTKERSSLVEIQSDFVVFNNRTFIGWLDFFNTSLGELSILELGGGPSQRAAREILIKYPHANYVILERRSSVKETEEAMVIYPNYEYIYAGISRMNRRLQNRKFSIIFAHNLAEHLSNPFYVIEESYKLLYDGGIFFANKIPIFWGEWEKISAKLKEGGTVFNSDIDLPPRELLKAGVVYLNLAVQKTSEDLDFPIEVRPSCITDISGAPQVTHEIFFATTS